MLLEVFRKFILKPFGAEELENSYSDSSTSSRAD